MYKVIKPYTLAGFEPGIFCFGGGLDDHYATARANPIDNLSFNIY
jgi:hypothetical protein